MNSQKNLYRAFSTVILRTPLLPLKFLASYADVKEQVFFKEALYFASPEIEEQSSLKDITNKANLAVYRYFERSCTRPTPFGLFAGISILRLDEKTNITLPDIKNCKPSIRLDMDVIYSFLHKLISQKQIREKLFYCRNNSIYAVGNSIRYIEYNYKDSSRVYYLSSVEATEYLIELLAFASERRTFDSFVKILMNKGYTFKESQSYIHLLIESQILISTIEPSVTNNNCLTEILTFLRSNNETIKIAVKIERIGQALRRFTDIGEEGSLSKLKSITQQLSRLGFKSKYLYQCDMIKPITEGTVSRKIIRDIEKAIILLNKCTSIIKNDQMKKFKEEFLRKYGDREMPLLFVLDQETGIGYAAGYYTEGISPLVDDLVIPGKATRDTINLNSISIFLTRKIEIALKENKKEVVISDHDIEDFDVNWEDLPTTFSVICSIIGDKDNGQKVHIKGVGGSSSANLISRFCHLDENIHNFVKEIVDKENQTDADIIIAEIVHIPEDRAMNILLRPNIRQYEIPYLSNSNVTPRYQIEPSDLMISIKNNKIVIRSKKLDKSIFPILTSAHDYSNNSLPVYKFLSDIQYREGRAGLGINLNLINKLYDYIPRIVYKNCILFRASWVVDKTIIEGWRFCNDLELLVRVNEWKRKMNVPQKVVLVDGDKELFVDLNCLNSIKSLLEVAKRSNKLYLEEFLFDVEYTDIIVKDLNDNGYTNEFIFSFYKNIDKQDHLSVV